MIVKLKDTRPAARLFEGWDETMIWSCIQGTMGEIRAESENAAFVAAVLGDFAFICCSSLIADCAKRGLYPSWDAQNKGSLALAEKLGYRFSHEYTAYEIGHYGGRE